MLAGEEREGNGEGDGAAVVRAVRGAEDGPQQGGCALVPREGRSGGGLVHAVQGGVGNQAKVASEEPVGHGRRGAARGGLRFVRLPIATPLRSRHGTQHTAAQHQRHEQATHLQRGKGEGKGRWAGDSSKAKETREAITKLKERAQTEQSKIGEYAVGATTTTKKKGRL